MPAQIVALVDYLLGERYIVIPPSPSMGDEASAGAVVGLDTGLEAAAKDGPGAVETMIPPNRPLFLFDVQENVMLS